MSRPKDEMHRAIDVLAKAMPNGQLMAAMGPLAFLGSAAEHIKSLGAEVERLKGELAAETASADAQQSPGGPGEAVKVGGHEDFCAVLELATDGGPSLRPCNCRGEPGGAPRCTGVSAAWCPVCGDCTCDREDGELNNPGCPLHAYDSHHADALVDPSEGELHTCEIHSGAFNEIFVDGKSATGETVEEWKSRVLAEHAPVDQEKP